jgi:hemerythrin-like domain-containing protein
MEATMDQQRPTAELESEHRVIERTVKAMALMAEQLESDRDVDVGILRDVIEFMRLYADKLHHGKEEAHMFPYLEERGVPASGCPMGVLLTEHDKGRTLVGRLLQTAELYERGAEEGRPELARVLRALIDLYPSHIWKEDYLLFPMTDKILSEADHRDLAARFRAVEDEMGAQEVQRLRELAERLERVAAG